MYKGNKYHLVRNFMTNIKSIYGLENQFSDNKFMDNTIQFVHKALGGVWVVIAISSTIKKDQRCRLLQSLSLKVCLYTLISCYLKKIIKIGFLQISQISQRFSSIFIKRLLKY